MCKIKDAIISGKYPQQETEFTCRDITRKTHNIDTCNTCEVLRGYKVKSSVAVKPRGEYTKEDERAYKTLNFEVNSLGNY